MSSSRRLMGMGQRTVALIFDHPCDGSCQPEEGWLAYYHRGKKMASVVADTKWVVCKSTLEKGGKTVYVPRSEYVYLSHDEMWQKLQEFDAANNLITCGVSMRGQGDDPLWDRLGVRAATF